MVNLTITKQQAERQGAFLFRPAEPSAAPEQLCPGGKGRRTRRQRQNRAIFIDIHFCIFYNNESDIRERRAVGCGHAFFMRKNGKKQKFRKKLGFYAERSMV